MNQKVIQVYVKALLQVMYGKIIKDLYKQREAIVYYPKWDGVAITVNLHYTTKSA